MDGSPALSLSLPEPGWWRRAVTALALLAAVTLGAWALQMRGSLAPWAFATAVGTGALALAAAWRVRRLSPSRLCWDTRQWRLEPARGQACSGTLAVTLDAGAWMLLRLDAESGPPAARRHWLAASRRALGSSDWHALRCAVYSARPAPGGSSAAASPSPHE